MNMKFAAIAALGTLALASAPAAFAADNGFYLGAGITQTEFDFDDIGEGKLDDNSFKIIAGFRPLDWLAFEANYIDLGGESSGGVRLDAKATTLSALAIAEIGLIDLYGRVGMANWDFDLRDGNLNFGDDGWEPTFGVGVGAHFGSLGVRAEYEIFKADLLDDIDTDVNTLSLSFTYTFL